MSLELIDRIRVFKLKNMKIYLIIPLILLTSYGQAQFKHKKAASTVNPPPQSQLITCDGIGIIKLSDQLKDLKEKVGTSNISVDSVYAEGDLVEIANVLWKGTTKEIRVYWKARKLSSKNIRVLEAFNPKSIYHFANGVSVGTTMAQLVKLNGGVPISFTGFGIDFPLAGVFAGFNGGKLSKTMPCFTGYFDESDYDSPSGDKIFRSDNPGVKATKHKLTSVAITKEDR